MVDTVVLIDPIPVYPDFSDVMGYYLYVKSRVLISWHQPGTDQALTWTSCRSFQEDTQLEKSWQHLTSLAGKTDSRIYFVLENGERTCSVYTNSCCCQLVTFSSWYYS
ncbi:hypothetical protein BD309DRAFT_676543 [Dichomitus squalens]|nr:hypothetical protein BD309DRAFT_676543 [Dichomitus squalens]